MDVYHKVVWSEGMLLTPHHFQHWDRYYSAHLTDRFRILSPLGWGVCQLDIDRDGLTNGNFTILGFQGIMPDGLLVRIPDQDAIPSTRLIGDLFSASMEHLDVFLGIPMEHVGMMNCNLGKQSGSRRSRYLGSSVNVPDHNTGENPRELIVAQKNLQVIFAGEELPDSSILKIAELVRTPGGAITLREAYIPPLVWASGSDSLMRLIRALLELLISMASALAEQQRGIREHGGMDLIRYSILHAISTHVPLLAHFSKRGNVHPEEVYLALARLAGELSMLDPDFTFQDFPQYDHANLMRTFRELDILIRKVVEHITPTRYVTIPLEKRGEYLWIGQISDAGLLKHGQFFIAASGGESEDQVRTMVGKRLKIGAIGDMELILNAAMPGVRLHHVLRPPASIPAKAGLQYFALESEGTFWDRICEGQVLAIYIPGDLQTLKIELLAVKE